VERQLGISVSYEREGPPVPIDTPAGIHVYRVMQEALSNVARHSSAKEAWVRLRSNERSIELDIEDHGVGLEKAAGSRGLGIIGMRERAEMLGGTIDFLEPPGGGTLVRLKVPIENQDGE
jgi:two-component system, NarL family, sensor histidine kinase UhpB